MNNYELAYQKLALQILHMGRNKIGRNGRVISMFGLTLCVNLAEGFPLLTGRKMYYFGVFGEMAAFIQGHDKLAEYQKLGCNYWNENAANWKENKDKPKSEWSIGQYVGSLWRDFSAYSEIQSDNHTPRDQLVELIDQLRNNPASRRHVLSAWHPAANSCLPPCTVMAIFNVEQNKLHCHVTQRSADVCLGVPSDIAGYALLVELLCSELGFTPGKLMFTFVDAHIYAPHISPLQRYLEEKIYELPKLVLTNKSFFEFTPENAVIKGYIHGPSLQFPFVV